MVNATPRPLYDWERDPVAIIQGAVWALGAVWPGVDNLTVVYTLPEPKDCVKSGLCLHWFYLPTVMKSNSSCVCTGFTYQQL